MQETARDRDFLDSCQPAVAEIFRYWDGRRGGRPMPRRADIDPLDIPRHLPGILLIDVEGIDGNGIGIYRYRVVGTREVQSRGYDPTGRLVVEGYFGPSLQAAISCYEQVRCQRSFLYEPLDFWTDERERIDEDSIVLPLSEDGETVSQILVYSERRPTD